MKNNKQRSSRGVTAKSLGLVDGSKLSASFMNTKSCFKVVTGQVIGYDVLDGGWRSFSRVAPIYEAWIHTHVGKERHILASFERGEYVNSRDFDMIDGLGNSIATNVAGCLRTLWAWRDGKNLAVLPKGKSKR